MRQGNFTFCAPDGLEIYVYKWLPDGPVKAAINLAHGMAETAARYERFAGKLTENGYAVYAQDLRGHGRTIKEASKAGEASPDCLNKMLLDLHQLSGIIEKETQAPMFFFGHSMGAFLAQGYIEHWGDQLKGAILSGAAGPADFLVLIGQGVAFLEKMRVGPTGRSNLLNAMSFGSFNNQFKPARTDFDWLSRDTREVDKYIADPFCGGVFPAQFFCDLLKFLRQIIKSEELQKIPGHLPLYFFSGEKDPVGANTIGVKKLIALYQSIGLKNLNFKFYEGGRHEMLNEINREEVMQDVIKWLSAHL